MPRHSFPPMSQILSGNVVLEVSFYSRKSSLLHAAAGGGSPRYEKGCNCDCGRRNSVMLALCRFLLLACYFVFLGGFWRSILLLKRSIHKQSCQLNQNTESRFATRGIWNATTDVEQENYKTFEDELVGGVLCQETTDWDSSGDSIGDDVHFVTYVEEEPEDDDGFQDDDYSDILTYSQILADDLEVDLEELLEQQEIDWDAPMPQPRAFETPLDDSFSSVSDQGIFFDDDYSTVMGHPGWSDFDIDAVADFLEDSYFPAALPPAVDSSAEADFFRETSLLKRIETSTAPLYDEEVLAAIIGLAEPEFKSTVRLLKSLGSSEQLYCQDFRDKCISVSVT